MRVFGEKLIMGAKFPFPQVAPFGFIAALHASPFRNGYTATTILNAKSVL